MDEDMVINVKEIDCITLQFIGHLKETLLDLVILNIPEECL